MFQKPSLSYEKKLWRQGYQNVVGLDEAGKGAWAGPIVAASIVLPKGLRLGHLGINDSKKLSPPKREKAFLKLTKIATNWSVGVVDHEHIDHEGIISANRLAMRKAIDKLHIDPHYLLIDGVSFFDHYLPHEFVAKGDSRVASIAAASIIAKVVRDQIMSQLNQYHLDYQFPQHKGYGTKLHENLLDQHGLSEIHRRSFRPMVKF